MVQLQCSLRRPAHQGTEARGGTFQSRSRGQTRGHCTPHPWLPLAGLVAVDSPEPALRIAPSGSPARHDSRKSAIHANHDDQNGRVWAKLGEQLLGQEPDVITYISTNI